jgi:pyruvate carboxylase subunit B
MKYVVDVNGTRTVVELAGGDEVRVGDQVLHARLSDIEGTPVSLLTVGERVYRVIARRGEGRGLYALSIDGHAFAVEALDERTRTIRDLSAASAVASGPAPLVAPMPGLVVRVNVAVGDQVAAGQGLVVMEAMKMENELRASAPGTVRAVHVEPGAAVNKGAVLVELA